MNQDNYNFINGFYIKKPGPNCQPDSIKHYEWFLKKVTDTPELMLRCHYCKKVYWTLTQNTKTKPYTNHVTTCKIKKNNIKYTGNIIIRS
jgi:hypothetical protein